MANVLLRLCVFSVSFLSQDTFGTNVSTDDLLPFNKSSFVLPNSDHVTIVSRITPNFKSIDFDPASETVVFECQYAFDIDDDAFADSNSAKHSNLNSQDVYVQRDSNIELITPTTSNTDTVHVILKMATIPNKKLNRLIQDEASILKAVERASINAGFENPHFDLIPEVFLGMYFHVSAAEGGVDPYNQSHQLYFKRGTSLKSEDSTRSSVYDDGTTNSNKTSIGEHDVSFQSDGSGSFRPTFDFSFLNSNETEYEYRIDTNCIEYFFQEYVSGSTTLIKDCTGDRKTDANPRDRIPLCEGLLNHVGIGMKHIYDETGFVHRDLSWNNIIVIRTATAGSDQVEITLKVIDWGAAALVNTTQNGMPGTAGFLAPTFKPWHMFDTKTYEKHVLVTEIDENGDEIISQRLIDRIPVLTHPVQDIWALLINVLFVLKEDPYIIHSGYFRANDTNNTMLPCIQDEWWQCEQSLKKFPNVQRRLEKNPFIERRFGPLTPNLANITTNAFSSISPILLPESVVALANSSTSKHSDGEQDEDDIDLDQAWELPAATTRVKKRNSFIRSPYERNGEYASRLSTLEWLAQKQSNSSLKLNDSHDHLNHQYGSNVAIDNKSTILSSIADVNEHAARKKRVVISPLDPVILQRNSESFDSNQGSFRYPDDMTIDDIHLQIQKDYVVQVESILQFVVDLMKKILANPTSVDWNVYERDLYQHNMRTASGSMTLL